MRPLVFGVQHHPELLVASVTSKSEGTGVCLDGYVWLVGKLGGGVNGLGNIDGAKVLDFGWVGYVFDPSKGEQAPHATEAVMIV